MVLVSVDFFRDTVNRVPGRLTEQINFVAPVNDDNPRDLDTGVKEQLASAIRGHFIGTGDCHIKSKDSILAGVLGAARVSISIEVDNADCSQRPGAGASRPVEAERTMKSFIRAGSCMMIVCMNWLYL